MTWKRYVVPLLIQFIISISRTVFNHFDADSDGKITREEYNDKVKELKKIVRRL